MLVEVLEVALVELVELVELVGLVEVIEVLELPEVLDGVAVAETPVVESATELEPVWLLSPSKLGDCRTQAKSVNTSDPAKVSTSATGRIRRRRL